MILRIASAYSFTKILWSTMRPVKSSPISLIDERDISSEFDLGLKGPPLEGPNIFPFKPLDEGLQPQPQIVEDEPLAATIKELVIGDSAAVKKYYRDIFDAMEQDSRTYLAKLWIKWLDLPSENGACAYKPLAILTFLRVYPFVVGGNHG